MDKTKIEALVTSCFSKCPFCGTAGSTMRFEWGKTIPRSMTCLNCRAEWELLFGLENDWALLGAKLVDPGSTKKGMELVGKLYDQRFWKKTVLQAMSQKTIALETDRVPKVSERIVVIREIVKIRCPYCGGLYDEVKDRCRTVAEKGKSLLNAFSGNQSERPGMPQVQKKTCIAVASSCLILVFNGNVVWR